MANVIKEKGAAKVARAAKAIREKLKERPRLGIVLGSGFAAAAQALEVRVRISYADIPGFPVPRVDGHCAELLAGEMGGVRVIMLCGRAHFYEGWSMEEVTFAMRVLHELGVEGVLLTNAAGSINRKFKAGTFMVLEDHINLMGANPLRGEISPKRFVDLSNIYDSGMRKLLQKAGRGMPMETGVYLAVAGPSYETSAEIRAFAKLGADAVGMSTAPEAIVGHFLGMRMAAVACITNMACGLGKGCLSHEDVLQAGAKHGRLARRLLENFCELYGKEG